MAGNSQNVSPVASQESPGTPRRSQSRRFDPRIDRFYSNCSVPIFNQVKEKPVGCWKCKARLRFRANDAVIREQDMHRCDDCNSYIHADDVYCHLCGKGSFKNSQKKRRLEAAAYKQEKYREGLVSKEKDAKIAKLEKDLAEALKKNEEMAADLKLQDETRMQKHPNQLFEDDDDEDELFNKAAENAENSQPKNCQSNDGVQPHIGQTDGS